MALKTCNKCGKEKSVSEFYARGDGKGYKSACKDCFKSKMTVKYRLKLEQEGKSLRVPRTEDEKRAISKAWKTANADKCKEYKARSSLRNADRIREQKRAEYARNAEKYRAYRANYYAENTEKAKAAIAKARAENPAGVASCGATRKARKKQAVPKWFGEFDEFVLSEAYDLARLREEATAIEWEVDHIVPIAGRLVTGLHVGTNIQVLPWYMNNFKRNKFSPSAYTPERTGAFIGV